jgi:hypothetical protein
MIVMACVSKQRLLTIMEDRDTVTISAACRAYQRLYRDEALARAAEIMSKNSTKVGSRTRAIYFGWFVGKEASLAQIRQILDQGDATDGDYRRCILDNLLRPERREEVRAEDYIADCTRLAASDRQSAELLGHCREICGGIRFSNIIEKVWAKLFAQQGWTYHNVLPSIAYEFSSSLNLVALCLADSSAEIRKGAICNIGNRELQRDRIKLVFPILDDSDIEVRRCAVWKLADELGIRVKVTPCLLLSGFSYNISNPYPNGSVPGEQNELDSIRAAAKKWLEQNKH